MQRKTILIIGLLLTVLVAVLAWATAPDTNQVSGALASVDENTAPSLEGFVRVTEPLPVEFPRDHGPHPEYRLEWWYYVGNLVTAEGRRFGYQLTFFRSALTPDAIERASSWGTNQVYMAHFALSDIEADQFHAQDRYTRGAAGLAGAQAEPYRVWLEDWSVEGVTPGVERLRAMNDGVAIDLALEWAKPAALHGNAGLSQKGAEAGNASMYYSLTRLPTQGTVTVDGQTFAVTGASWMDHEYGTSALGAQAVGWDWFALQLDDGSELMLYRIRRDDGTYEPQSSGSLVAPDGTVTPLAADEMQIEVLDTWQSPHTGTRYPARWRIDIPRLALTLEVVPRMADQELRLATTYWEGAVSIVGTRGDQPITGQGYVELTGYNGSLRGRV